MSLHVFYGYAKLNKSIKKPSLKIIFENADNNPQRNLSRIKSWMHIVCVRVQTKEEALDAQFSNRVFTVYEHFINEKPYYGDIDHLLDVNFQADSNHVPVKKREEIRMQLQLAYSLIYKDAPKIDNTQLSIRFYAKEKHQ